MTTLAAPSAAFSPGYAAWPPEAPFSRLTFLPAAPAEADLSPLVVYSPHPDDETWAMAHAIRSAVQQGRPVYGVLLSDGEGSGPSFAWYASKVGTARDLNGDGAAGDAYDLGMERRAEYVRAMRRLRVPSENLSFEGCAASSGKSGLRNDGLDPDLLWPVIERYAARFPDAEHVTVMKHTDGLWNGVGDARPHPDHTAACDALREVAVRKHLSAAFYKVYVYRLPEHFRWAPTIEFGGLQHREKVLAMEDGFGTLDPASGRYALGRIGGTLAFYDAMALDLREYRVELRDVPPRSDAATTPAG